MTLAERLLAQAPKSKAPKVLTVDIETSPNICYVWSLFGEQHISPSQILEPSRVLCFAAKWLGNKRVEFYSEHHHSREEMIRESWRLYDEADIVVTYNGPGFDNKHLAREWLMMGLGPPSPWVDVDLLAVNRRRFKFTSNKLGYVTEALGLPTKLDTGGQALWNAVLAGDDKAWEKFKRYNVQDAVITEQLLVLLRDWTKLPHMGLWNFDKQACHRCGGDQLNLCGVIYTQAMAYPKLLCETCGAWNKLLRNGETRPA